MTGPLNAMDVVLEPDAERLYWLLKQDIMTGHRVLAAWRRAVMRPDFMLELRKHILHPKLVRVLRKVGVKVTVTPMGSTLQGLNTLTGGGLNE